MENKTRILSDRDLAFDQIADVWRGVINNYDTGRRIEVLIGDFLGDSMIRDKSCFEAGCGIGFFTKEIWAKKPARLVSVDLSPKLIEIAKREPMFNGVEFAVADILAVDKEKYGTFDVVLSSEVIEHTPDPIAAVGRLASLVHPGGVLVLSCPNTKWKWLLHLAQFLGLRKHYKGYENWLAAKDLLHAIEHAGLEIVRAEGIHTVPWQFLPKFILRQLDKRLRKYNYSIALNLAVLARRL
jgi:2-polyprenyl-3-methyl-5-hydroxy-6-metoxy-1,4-benzoquinol methylase